jgi:hypothetical protein
MASCREVVMLLLLLIVLLLLVAAWHVAAGTAFYLTAVAHAARQLLR